MELFFGLSAVMLLVGALLWWRIDQIEARLRQRIDEADERARIQVDSYGATVGEFIDEVQYEREKGNK
jgi:uncharacterized iron-regulated membrane protein